MSENDRLPSSRELMPPTVEALRKLGGSGRVDEINNEVIHIHGFSEEQLAIRSTKNDGQSEIYRLLGWSRTLLKRDGVIQNSAWGVWTLSEQSRGLAATEHDSRGGGLQIKTSGTFHSDPVSGEMKKTSNALTEDSCSDAFSGWHHLDFQEARRAERREPVAFEDSLQVEQKPDVRNSDPVGGSSALREAHIRKDPAWLKGATGEYLMGVSLEHRLTPTARVLTDRQLPGTKANIDHIVVAASGVWIIDSKKWKGKIAYKAESIMSINTRLYVDGKDRTPKVESIYGAVIPIAQLIGDRSIPIHPALVFIEGDWSGASFSRFVMGRPYLHEGVYISPPKLLIKLINRPGPLDVESIGRIADKLDEKLKPR
jgi:hypothetical protein